jgi:hypothetical protein
MQDCVPNWQAVGFFYDTGNKFMNIIPITFMLQATENTIRYDSLFNRSTF